MADTLNLYQKILKITEEVGHLEKTGRNSQQGYAFIEQSQVVAALRPQLAKYGVAIMPETTGRSIERYDVTRSNGKQGVDVHASVTSRYTVINADNPDERFVCEWDGGEAIDSGDKATNKAVTASDKNFLIKLFKISDKEDADADSPEAAPQSAAKPSRPSVGTSTPRPVPESQPKTTGKLVNEAQIKLLLARSRDASGLTDRQEIYDFFLDTFGKMPNQVTQDELDGILKQLPERQDDEHDL